MCMLYGFSSKDHIELGPTLKEFFYHSIHHSDGWGIGFYDHGVQLFKEPQAAHQSKGPGMFSNMRSNLCIAHIRKATTGFNHSDNTHPFKIWIGQKVWLFAHNGTIDRFAFDDYELNPKGDTDSELCGLLIKYFIENHTNEVEAIEMAVEHLAKFGKFNMILTDGKKMYYHTNMKNTLYLYKSDNLMCLVTKKLKTVKNPKNWHEVELNRLFACERGKLKYQGKPHKYEYKRLTK